MISIIAAMANHRVIGRNNALPWRMPADLKHFKAVTMGKPVIMGRKTFASIGKPLPGRRNIVVSTQSALTLPGCEVFDSFERALAAIDEATEAVVIGGAQIYAQALPLATRMYLTVIDLDIEGDAFFPEWDERLWKEVSRVEHAADEKNSHPFNFVELQRR